MEKREGGAISFSYNIKAVGENIKLGRGEGTLKSWGRKSILEKKEGGEEYHVVGNFIPAF